MEQEEVRVQLHVDIIHNSKLLTWQWFVGVYSDLPRLVNDVIRVFGDSHVFGAEQDPRHIYRSILPFLPPSSPILVHYNMLSDPIKVLRMGSRNNSFQRGDPRITCTALSDDGRRVALGFHNGVVEVVDTQLNTMTSRSDGLPGPPVWLLFIGGGHKLVIETSKRNIYIRDIFTLHQQRIASGIDGSTMVVASLSHDGSMIVRAAQHSTKEWYENMYIIDITTDRPTIHSLSTPSNVPDFGARGRFPLQRSVGFSPDGQYAAAFDTTQAFVWSCTSFQLIAHCSIDPHTWFLNTHRPSTTIPTLALPNDVIITPFPKHSGSISSTSCVLFKFAPIPSANLDRFRMQALSLAAAAVAVLSLRRIVWFKGRKILAIPDDYWNSIKPAPKFDPFYWELPSDSSFLASKDGTRFLLFDKERCPVLVDISEVISDRTT